MTQPSSEFLDLQAALAGEYSLQRELGRGGMGVVYLARDVHLDRDVAIKVLPGHLAARAEDRERFLREARTAAGLSHPHIVPIHRVGEAGGFVFFVMSYIAGETLGERLRRAGPLPAADATRIMREVAWALAHAHGRGIVHRDVKPDNILLEQGSGRAVVTDFGIARGGTDSVTSTDPGRIMGTAHFMSPEQAATAPLDGRSDIYSLGVVGYLAVSGRLPFDTPNLPALLVRQATEAAPSVATSAPGLPSSLVQVIDRCLQRDAARRFADGESLAAALVPPVDSRPPLPSALRAWLNSRNSLESLYALWSGFILVGAGVTVAGVAYAGDYHKLPELARLIVLGAAPILPILGFHLSQARRLFRAGYTLADLRAALATGERERAEAEALITGEQERWPQRLIRYGTYLSLAVGAGTLFAAGRGMLGAEAFALLTAPWAALAGFLLVGNSMEVTLAPAVLRRRVSLGVRAPLWQSRLGAWLAKRLGAPEHSRAVGAGVFRATEVALGVAAAELFAALPKAYREQLAELPRTVVALEARAAGARTEVEALAALGPDEAGGEDLLAQRRANAAGQLASTVAALEGIRLDLLRLHAGASDLAPLTTLIDAARLLGEDVGRLADARREAGESVRGDR